MTLFAVTLKVGDEYTSVYGPFDDAQRAQDFRDFLTAEVDPARVVIMSDPVGEMLSWRKTTQRNEAQQH